jgi:hypothetical protein
LYRTVILTEESFEYAWNPGWDAWAVYTKLKKNGFKYPSKDNYRTLIYALKHISENYHKLKEIHGRELYLNFQLTL